MSLLRSIHTKEPVSSSQGIKLIISPGLTPSCVPTQQSGSKTWETELLQHLFVTKFNWILHHIKSPAAIMSLYSLAANAYHAHVYVPSCRAT